jgi:cardiolipin synthase
MKNKSKSPTHQKRPIQYYASTLLLVLLLVCLEIAILALHVFWISRTISVVNLGLRLLSFFVMLHIINQDDSNAYKLAWCIPILLIPLVGGLSYLIAQSRSYHKKAKKRFKELDALLEVHLEKECFCQCSDFDNERVCHYLKNNGFSAHTGDKVQYYAMGEDMFADFLDDLKTAEHFIFLEYFIVQEGVMWNSILEILKEKAAKGVDVRVMYDGMGCIRTLPRNYPKQLANWNIKAKVFSPFVPVLSTLQNNRDHRKIAVIDGKVAYTGGINLADEYINEIRRYGVWKDSAIRMEGSSADSFTKFFLGQWYLDEKEITDDIASFFKQNRSTASSECVIPYSVSPLGDTDCGKDVYLQIISCARSYVYIMTPYLIPGEELMNAMMLAAQSGVDVRILTPHISDKALVHIVTRSKYEPLIHAGVKVYEYTPGFIHSKNTVCDDYITTCGSVNMDYRSLFLHFECGSVIYGDTTARAVKEDFLKTCEIATEITPETAKKRSFFAKVYLAFIRNFEPLL